MDNKAFESETSTNGVTPSDRSEATVPQNGQKFTIYRNLLVISGCFILLFTAFSALSNIQSSLNSDQGLGTTSLSVIYAAMVISCMFVPTAFIRKVGCKWTMVISMLAYSAYIGANFYATWATLIPASILLGLGAAPLWSAKCTFLTEMGKTYVKYHEKGLEQIINRFFGIFFMLFQSAQIWGNLISANVLKPTEQRNLTIFKLREGICGSAYCNEDLSVVQPIANLTGASTSPEMQQVYMLCGIYLGCALLAIIVMSIFLSDLQRSNETPEEKISSVRLLVATAHHLKNPKQLLLIPLTIFSGMEQAFIASDFTNAFVNCSLGIHNVGSVMIAYGVTDALCSFGFGYLMKLVGRMALFLLAALLNITVITGMFLWRVDSDSVVVFYVIAALWGMADAVWQTQINALYGALFQHSAEAAFSNYRLWESIGFIVAFAWASFVCVRIKLWVILGVLVAGLVGYLTVEIQTRASDRKFRHLTKLTLENKANSSNESSKTEIVVDSSPSDE